MTSLDEIWAKVLADYPELAQIVQSNAVERARLRTEYQERVARAALHPDMLVVSTQLAEARCALYLLDALDEEE